MRLKQEYRNETVIQKSRFIACVSPVRTEEEARIYIEEIRKEFPDADHVCTAYMCGENDQFQRSSDNREPSGTAGIPMLETIRSSGLKDVCACVVRYFGGIKLGTGGLARAYSGAVAEALHKADKTEEVILKLYTVTYPYELSGTLENWLRKNTYVKDMLYDENVTCLFETDHADIETVVQNLSKGSITPAYVKDVIRETDIEQD